MDGGVDPRQRGLTGGVDTRRRGLAGGVDARRRVHKFGGFGRIVFDLGDLGCGRWVADG